MPFAAIWMQLNILILSEISQKEKGKYHMISLILESKYGINESIYKKKKKQTLNYVLSPLHRPLDSYGGDLIIDLKCYFFSNRNI